MNYLTIDSLVHITKCIEHEYEFNNDSIVLKDRVSVFSTTSTSYCSTCGTETMECIYD